MWRVDDARAAGTTAGGALAGVSLAVKDLFYWPGRISSFGHPRWRSTHEAAEAPATILRRLTAEGAGIVGFAKMDQLAYSLVGNIGEGEAPVNPRFPDRFAGGSSSGSAVAVASGNAAVGLGTDTAGSVRVPAACCGVAGFRPTHGSLPVDGVIPLAGSFDVPGFLAQRLDLLRRSWRVARGDSPVTESADVPVKSVVVAEDSGLEADRAVADCVRFVARQLASAHGTGTSHQSFEYFFAGDSVTVFSRIQGREIWQAHEDWIRGNIDALDADVQTRLRRAEEAFHAAFDIVATDDAFWRDYARRADEQIRSGEVVVKPVMTGLPPTRTSGAEELVRFRSGCLRYNAMGSLTGFPELVLPCYHRDAQQYVGVALMARRGDDDLLFRAAEALIAGAEPIMVG